MEQIRAQTKELEEKDKKEGSRRMVDSSHKEGELLKLGAKVKKWRTRYFVLEDERLSYYKSKDSKKPMGVVRLSSLWQISRQTPSKELEDLPFLMSLAPTGGNDRQFLLAAQDEQDLEQWINAIKLRLTAVAPVFEGNLWKQGGVVKNWQSRYFKLGPGTLSYYKSNVDKTAAGTIPLSHQTVVAEAGDQIINNSKKFLFTISSKSSSRVYYIAADVEAYRKEWIAHLWQMIQTKIQLHLSE